MAAASPLSIDFEGQRAELEAVLQSRYFTRAPAIARLLSYLCEKLFDGEANRIKEYTVAVDVFHRKPSFDQNSDSIVRVEANRLRKRLAVYYANEGLSHRLHITIPVGRYVPEFEPAFPPQIDRLSTKEAQFNAIPARIEITTTSLAGNRHRNRDRLAWRLGAGFAPLMMVLVLPLVRHCEHSLPHVATDRSSVSLAESEVGLPMGDEVRILAGAGRSFVDHAGKLWVADTWFEGGTAEKSSVQNIWRTQDAGFYRTSRQGQFRYKIPLQKGIYELRLYLAETAYGPESNGTGGEGSRVFTVRANGKTLLSRFDLVADAGGSRTADVKVFPDVGPAADGFLHLEFSAEDGKQAILSAIEILPGMRGHIRPVRLLARQTPYYSNDSHWWSPDNYFQGGQLATYTSPVSGTDDPELYEAERWGNFSYAIPVSPGRYSVTLYFAARHGEWDQSSPSFADGGAAVAHIFNVFCNGTILLKDFNLAREARRTDVVIRKFEGLEPSAQGKLLLSFVPVEGYATVTGIEVLPL